jgi:hypothetical protein
MEQKANSLLATFKNVSTFGTKYVADFTAASIGGQQFAIVTNAVTSLGSLGSTQVSGGEQTHAGVLSKAVGRVHLHDDMIAITNAAHSLVLMGNATIAGKFLMPHSNGDQSLLNSARAFQTDAAAFSAALIGLGLPADFITHLGADITAFETAVTAKGAAQSTQGGATGGIADAAHQAAIALHILDTVVKNTYKANPQKLAEWAIASHVEKHTPVPHAKPAATTTPSK